MQMSWLLVHVLIGWFVGAISWYFVGRSHGRASERKKFLNCIEAAAKESCNIVTRPIELDKPPSGKFVTCSEPKEVPSNVKPT